MSGLIQEDFDWIRGMVAGRTPAELERMKAVVQRMCEDFDNPRPLHLNPALPQDAHDVLLEAADTLTEARAMLFALEMACSDVGDADAGDALRSVAFAVNNRIVNVRGSIECLRQGKGEPACA